MSLNVRDAFVKVLGEERALAGEPMSGHTTFRIGGPADHFLIPKSEEELGAVLKICREAELPWFILGNGSNLLVSDSGYRGAVICIYRGMQELTVTGSRIRAQAGVLLAKVSSAARSHSLKGLEFAGGIPGTVGGAVMMNAGAYGGEICQVLVSARTMTPEGEARTVPAQELELGYRTSRIGSTGEIVLEAEFELEPGDGEAISARMQELARQRSEKQPLDVPSAGSTFKRPEGHFAGKLIMDCGLRGYRVGGAQVSEKHCGFVVNTGGATASDVRTLMQDVRRTVYRETGVVLEPEVRFLGEFTPWQEN